jgi:serine/threonine protein kinase
MDAYKDLQEIGKGSFATVYKATTTSGLPVAIKTVIRSKLNRKLQDNLDMEIAILNEARHRNVVSLYNVLVLCTNLENRERDSYCYGVLWIRRSVPVYQEERGGSKSTILSWSLGWT